MSNNNRESENNTEEFIDTSPYDDLQCMEIDRDLMFEVYEPEKAGYTETDKKGSETPEIMEHSVTEKEIENSSDEFEFIDCSEFSSEKFEEPDSPEESTEFMLKDSPCSIDQQDANEEITKLLTAPITTNKNLSEEKVKLQILTSELKDWAAKPRHPKKRQADEQNSFQNRRNKWMRLEKLPAHRRLPRETSVVKKWTTSINFKTVRALSIACKYQNWPKIAEILHEAEKNYSPT